MPGHFTCSPLPYTVPTVPCLPSGGTGSPLTVTSKNYLGVLVRITLELSTVEPADKGQRYKGELTITVKTLSPIQICMAIRVCLAIEYKGGRSCLVTIQTLM